MIRAMRKDLLIAVAPIIAGLGLAAAIHKVEAKMSASVTPLTHGAIPSR